ncbi:phenylacetate--CoA ligase family protein [Methanosarcina sp.]|uniref:phenylacetate--CoA ligase family protein n=1 Tax=Methanosarcina sp. TaxID=2213 RepID=UPI003BB7045C
MSIESKMLKCIAFPLNDMVRGTNSVSYSRTLEETQWLSPSQIKKLQEKKLHALIEHAYKNVPYYKRMLDSFKLKPDDVKSIDDLSKLPLLTKEIIRENSKYITSQIHNKNKIKFLSGGTTGEPLISYKDKGAISCGMAAAYRGWSWGNYTIGDRYAMLWRSPETSAAFNNYSKRFVNIVRRNLFLYAFDLSDETLYNHIVQLRKFEPKIIRISPSGGYALAELMKRENINDICPTSILSTAEKLYDFQRKAIESQFGCKIFDSYGSNEIRSIAFECEEHNGYHISAENLIVEFIKDDENVADNELGEIVITDLTNYAMPFIRYKIGDVGSPSNETCSCGRGLPLMKSVEGRISDLIVTPKNRLLKSSYFVDLFNKFDFVKQFQVMQETSDRLKVKVVCKAEVTEEKLERLAEHLQTNTDNMTITIKCVDTIPPAKSGKLQLTISNIKIRPQG